MTHKTPHCVTGLLLPIRANFTLLENGQMTVSWERFLRHQSKDWCLRQSFVWSGWGVEK